MGLEFTDRGSRKIKWMQEIASMRIEFGVVDEEMTTNGVPVWQYGIAFNYGKKDQNIQVARPFFTQFILQQKTILNEKAKREFTKVMNGHTSPLKAYQNLGDYLKAGIENSLSNGSWTELKSSTLKQKKGGRIGVDTGNLLRCIGYIIYQGDSIVYKRVGGGRG